MDKLKHIVDFEKLAINCIGTTEQVSFTQEIISSTLWDSTYKNWIKSIPNKSAVYSFSINDPDNIVYIGMSGKINNGTKQSQWLIRNRLKASRGKGDNGKDVLTPEFIRQIFVFNHLQMNKYKHLSFGQTDLFFVKVFYPKENILSGFLEATLINLYLLKNSSLPQLNLSF